MAIVKGTISQKGVRGTITQKGVKGDIAQTSFYHTQYQAVYNAMSIKPNAANILIQDKMLTDLYEGGYFTKAELLDVFAAHTGGSLVNWKNPGTFDPTVYGSPVFTQYGGYTGGAGWVELNFIPSTNGTLIGQNNICVMIGVADDVAENANDFGAAGASYAGGLFIQSRNASNLMSSRCNNLNSTTKANASSIAHYAISRNSSTSYDYYINSTKYTATVTSDALCAKTLVACGFNYNGSVTMNTKRIPYVFLFSYLTETEITGVRTIMETYLDSYSKGLI